VTRASIEEKRSLKVMDCRVKPGNDASDNLPVPVDGAKK
jgi:hypothetical protein